MEYWDYYKNDFDWNDQHERLVPDFDFSRQRFAEIGLSEPEIDSFVKSGYVVLKNDVIIDRFYGGALLSSDYRTRIRASDFFDSFKNGSNNVPVYYANSMTDVLNCVEKWRARHHKPLLFRGQINNYPLTRERPNPYFQISGMGEISLMPSLWRIMRQNNPMSFRNFDNLGLFEWSNVIYSQFDIAEIERRQAKINAEGGWIHSAQDMADSDASLLQEFGNIRLDLQMGLHYNLADSLNTLLQHYGLYSPVLDLTTDLDVALFFATHEMKQTPHGPYYDFVGSNCRKSILICISSKQRNA